MIALEAAVHDGGVALLRDTFLGDLGVDPVGEAPHVGADLAKLNGGGRVVLDGVLEGLVEVAIVEEDVGVVVPAIEVALDGLDGLDDTIQLLVPGQDDKGTVGPGLGRVGFQAALNENLVVFLTDFPVGERARSAGNSAA